MAVGVEGATMAVFDYAVEQLKKQSFMVGMIKTLKQYTDGVLAVGLSAVSIALAAARMPEIAVRAVRVIGSLGVKKLIENLACMKPAVIALDTSNIEAFCLDASKTVNVFVDESEVSFQTPPTTDSKGYVKITLPSPLSKGSHKILVHTNFKAAYTEQYVS